MSVDFGSARVLCLFSGSGQMGIECHSRGSSQITFNDIDKSAITVIKKNCASVNLTPQILNLDYRVALEKLRGRKFDLVFLDPPFADIDAPVIVSNFLLENGMLNDGAVVVCETEKDGLEFHHDFVVREKRYGRAVVYFLVASSLRSLQ